MERQGNQSKQIGVKEIRRQKVYVPKSMTTNQVMQKYGLKPGAPIPPEKRDFHYNNILWFLSSKY